MRIQRLIVALILALSFSIGTIPLQAANGSKGSGHSTKSSSPKTVHVKEYTRKDGTNVKAHDRAAPKSKTATSATKATTPKETKHESTPAVVTAARDANGKIKRSESARHAFEVQTG